MFSKKQHNAKKSEDVKRSAGKVVDPKRDTQQRSKHLRLFLDHAETHEIVSFFETYYSHIFYIVYDAFITAEINLRQKGAHKAQREELEAVLYLFEKILIYLPEHLGRKWQYHSVGRLMSKLLHPGNSWKLLKREAMRLFLLWYQILGDIAGEPLHAMFATLVPGFPSPYQGLGLTALAAMTPDTQDGPVNPAEICPLIPPQSGERWRSPDTDLTRIFLDVLLELMVTQVTLIEWKENKHDRQRRCLNFLFERFKMFYMMHIFPDFNWSMSLYRPSLELPETRKFRPAFVDIGDGTKKMDPMLSCRVVVIKWVAQYTHLTRTGNANNATLVNNNTLNSNSGEDGTDLGGNITAETGIGQSTLSLSPLEESTRNTVEGNLVREILYGNKDNVNFVHEVYRQAFLLSFSHSPAIKKVISVYKDWIQMNVPELPPFLLEPLHIDKEREDFRSVMEGKISADDIDSIKRQEREQMAIRAGMQNVLQVFVTNAANVFLLEVSAEYPILLEEQVEMCKRVLNIYRYMVMNVKMEARTWEQLLFILLQITQLTLPENPPRKREDTLGGRLAQAIFQTLIVTWIKANLYVVVSTELWDQFLEVLSSLTLWEELIREWAKTMETLTRVLARQVYNLDLNDLPLDRLSERAAAKRRRGAGGGAGGVNGRSGQSDSRFSHAIKTPSQVVVSPAAPTVAQVTVANNTLHHQESSLEPPHSATGHESAGSGAGSIVGPSAMQHDVLARRASPYGARHRMNSSEMEFRGVGAAGHDRRSRRSNKHRTNLIRSHSDSSVFTRLSDYRRESTRLEEEMFRLRHYNSATTSKPRGSGVSRNIGGGVRWNLRRRHRSADSVFLADTEFSGAKSSRSSSPAPSSGIESNSIKDSPLQLDHDTMSDSGMMAVDHLTRGGSGASEQPRSVMAGGAVKGWLPDVAVVLWRRMLGALGNINRIADTVIHAMIYKYLIELFEIMVKIRSNQGVAVDNTFTPPPPEYVPPFTIFAPWCFRALSLPDTYARGRLYALRLLCLFTCRPHDSPLPKTHLVQFYRVLHDSLTAQNRPDVINTVVRFTGPRFFSLMLPGYTAYILDYLYAANCVISSSELKGVPRTEATSVVGALLPFPAILPDIPLLLPNSNELSLISSADVKDQIIGVLLKSGKKEPSGLARCISLSSLGIFVYSELVAGSFHPKMKESIQVLLTALRFNNKAVAQIASDMLLLLADHVSKFLDFYPEVPKKIVEVLARTLSSLTPPVSKSSGSSNNPSEDEKRLMLSLLLCLGEWVMRMPNYALTQPQEDGRSLLHHVFGALQTAGGVQAARRDGASTSPSPLSSDHARNRKEAFPKQVYGDVTRTILSPAVMMSDFDPNIHVDNTKEGPQSNAASPMKQGEEKSGANNGFSRTPLDMSLDDNDGFSPIRLAARTLLSHLMNHLFHFPMGVGASSLSSLVCEHDDGLNKTEDTAELTMDVFNAPNIQFFILNSTTLLSFVELPALDMPGSLPGLSSSRSQVRVILRDVSGKFCWDSTALYGPPLDHEGLNLADEKKIREKFFVQSPKRSKRASKKGGGDIQAWRSRGDGILPTHKNTADDMDDLDDLLKYLSYTSPECLDESGRALNSVVHNHHLNEDVEKEVIAALLNQRNHEQEQNHRLIQEAPVRLELPPLVHGSGHAGEVFQQCRRLFSQLGLDSWEQRPNVQLVKKNEKLLRELKNLDSKRCREAHKIAVIYVAEGQEDKQSILSNASGSQAYEEFVSGLAWEVELETHTGFMGGLKKTKTTGETSPYYATSFVEVMFHVATRMPSNNEENMIGKTRHIGNDEIHIVWSEHWRDYRRGILPTEFCDVLIVIYPLKNRLFRVQVIRKPEVPFFGPLYNEVIVNQKVLPGLVRATAINASRAKRSMLTYYQHHYEERARALQLIITNHRLQTTFEDFVTQAFSPKPLENLFQQAQPRPLSLLATSLGPSLQLSDTHQGGHFFSSSMAEGIRPRTKTEGSRSPSNFSELSSSSTIELSPVRGKRGLGGGKRPVAIKEEATVLPPPSPQETSPSHSGPSTRRR